MNSGFSGTRSIATAAWSVFAIVLNAQLFQPWQHITSHNGLPQNSVMDLATDTMGYLWVTTEAGLVRYDGRSFLPFDLPGDGSPRSLRMRYFVETPDDQLYVDDARGNLYAVHGHHAVFRVVKQGHTQAHSGLMPSLELHLKTMDRRRPLKGEVQWKNRSLRTVAFDLHNWAMAVDSSILLFRDSSLLATIPVPPTTVGFFQLGRQAYLLDANGGLLHLVRNAHALRPVTPAGQPLPVSVPNAPVQVFHSGKDHVHLLHGEQLWMVHATGGALQCRRVDAQLPTGTRINDILYLQKDQLLAIGTATKGLHLLRPKPMRTIGCPTSATGLENGFYAQLELEDDHVLTTGYSQHGMVVTPDGCHAVHDIATTGLAKDAQGRLLYMAGGHLQRSDLGTAKVEQLSRTRLPACSFLPEGDSVWVGHREAIGYLRGDSLHWTARISLFDDDRHRPIAMVRDPQGRMCYASCYGLFMATDKGCTEFKVVAGFEGRCARALATYGDKLLVGTYGDGAYIVRKGIVHRFPSDRQGAMNEVHGFHLDNKDVLWMSTNHGLLRITMKDLDLALADSTYRPYIAAYTEWAGMASSEFNGGCQPPHIRLRNGMVSYPTMDGLVQFVPELIEDPFPQAPILTEHVFVDGRKWSSFEYLIFKPGTQEITIEFSAPYWGQQANMQLEYRIKGLQETWLPLEPEARDLRIVRPPPGDYALTIRKVGAATRGDMTEAQLWFRVEIPFYLTWYGMLLILSVTVFVLWSLLKLNIIRLRRRNRWLEESVAEQTEALLLANGELRNEMSHQEKLISIFSHDVVPPLRFLSRVARSAEELFTAGRDPDLLADTLTDLSTSSDKLFHNTNSLLAWIRSRSVNSAPEFRSISLHAFVGSAFDRIREMTNRQGLVLNNNVDPDEIVVTDEDLLGIIVNNILLNAKLHSQAGHISISGSSTDVEHTLLIDDDGIGIEPEILMRIRKELNGTSKTDHTDRGPAAGIGYVIMAECIRSLGGSIRVACDATGTQVSVHLPVPPPKRN